MNKAVELAIKQVNDYLEDYGIGPYTYEEIVKDNELRTLFMIMVNQNSEK